MSLSGGRGSVWLRQAGHGGTGGCDAGCRSAHVRFQDAELSGHQMGPQRHEGTLCNNTQGTSGGVAGALHLLLLLCVPVFTQSLPPPSFLFFSISPRPYVKLWRSGRTHATPQGRDDGAEPRLSDVTLIFILNTVGTCLPFFNHFLLFNYSRFPYHLLYFSVSKDQWSWPGGCISWRTIAATAERTTVWKPLCRRSWCSINRRPRNGLR